MAMTRDFTWNRNSGNTLEDAAKAFELAQALASDAYWKERDREDAMQAAVESRKAEVGARHPGLMMPTGTPSGVPSEAYQQAKAQQDAAIAQKVARLKELEMARAEKMQKFRDDPKFQMAAMLAMAGQPGALQSLIAEGSKSGNSVQSDMDALEKSMTNDIFALASANEDQSAKIMEALIPLYKSKFEEIQGKGGMSRLGGWDAWEKAIRSAKGRSDVKKAKKDELDAALDKSAKNLRGN
jgi:hypothetical protein